MPGPHHTSSHRFHPDEILWPGENHTIGDQQDRKSTRLNSSHTVISYAVFCLKKKSNSHYIRHATCPPSSIALRYPLISPLHHRIDLAEINSPSLATQATRGSSAAHPPTFASS